MDRAPISPSARLFVVGIYAAGIRAGRLSRLIAAMEPKQATGIEEARRRLAFIQDAKEFTEAVFYRELGDG